MVVFTMMYMCRCRHEIFEGKTYTDQNSLSVLAYRVSTLFRVLLAKAMECQSHMRSAVNPYFLVLFWMISGFALL